MNTQSSNVKRISPLFFGYLCLLTLLSLAGFRTGDDKPTYKAQLEQWHQERIASLKSESGWLNLAGLFWLKEGENTVGATSASSIEFPADKVPTQLGTFRLENGTVTFDAAKGAAVTADEKPVETPITVFAPDLKKSVILQYGSLRWFIIKRGNKYGIRLRDLKSQALSDFHGINRYSVDEAWRVTARLEKPTEAKTIAITDVLGMTSQQPLAGTLVFDHQGKTYRLDAVGEGEKLFVIFGDATNGSETYGSGRFLYVDKPETEAAPAVIDFNKSINPPCAFTPYATCPLPPKQNRLAIRIPAGEKAFDNH